MRTFVALVWLAAIQCCEAQETYFYHHLPYGSESAYSPVSLLLNGGFDVFQFDGMPKNAARYPYAHASREVFRNLSSPLASINQFGWKNFLQQEVLLFNFSPKKSQGWPNYNLHLIGGGMSYALMTEWYEARNVPYPSVMSAATVGVQHVLNEVVENGPLSGNNVDPIADIYIFDIGGMVLFSSDAVKNFFGTTLNMRDWSLQPMYSPGDGSLLNNGQYFSMKWKWFGSERWSAFYFFGLEGLAGVSYLFDTGESISGGFGLRGKRRVLIDEQYNRYAVQMSGNIGIFYDRNGSLLASMFLSSTLNDRVTFNLYPGVLDFAGISPGVVFILDHSYHPTAGITFSYIPGIAVYR